MLVEIKFNVPDLEKDDKELFEMSFRRKIKDTLSILSSRGIMGQPENLEFKIK